MISKNSIIHGIANMLKEGNKTSTDDAVIDLVADILTTMGTCESCSQYAFIGEDRVCKTCGAIKAMEDICD